MSDKRYRAVVVGCGKVGATFEMDSGLIKPASHAAALAANPRTELVGLVDHGDKLVRATDYYHVPGYTDAEACLAVTKPDLVVIATPPETHEALLALALAHNPRAIILEKPVSDALDSAQRMTGLAEASSSIIILNHQRRFFPLYQEARKKIVAGELGRIQQVTGYYTNGILNNGSHLIDALHFLLDDTTVWAVGAPNDLNTAAPFGPNIDGLLGLGKGTIAAIQSLDNNAFNAHELQIVGTQGALMIRQNGFRFDYVPLKEGVTFAGVKELDWMHPETKTEKRSMIEATIVHAVERIDGEAEAQNTLPDGYRAMEVLDALVRSAADGGKKVKIG